MTSPVHFTVRESNEIFIYPCGYKNTYIYLTTLPRFGGKLRGTIYRFKLSRIKISSQRLKKKRKAKYTKIIKSLNSDHKVSTWLGKDQPTQYIFAYTQRHSFTNKPFPDIFMAFPSESRSAPFVCITVVNMTQHNLKIHLLQLGTHLNFRFSSRSSRMWHWSVGFFLHCLKYMSL